MNVICLFVLIKHEYYIFIRVYTIWIYEKKSQNYYYYIVAHFFLCVNAVASGLNILQNMYTGNPHLSCSQVREFLYNTSKDSTQQQWIHDKIGLHEARVNQQPWAHYKGWMMGW